jgi:hypothetical protein
MGEAVDHVLLRSGIRVFVEVVRTAAAAAASTLPFFLSTVSTLDEQGLNSTTFYEKEFEFHFIKSTEHFYAAEAQEFVAANSVSDYLLKVRASMAPNLRDRHRPRRHSTQVEQRLKEEEDRCNNYLRACGTPRAPRRRPCVSTARRCADKSTESKLRAVLDRHLLSDVSQQLIEVVLSHARAPAATWVAGRQRAVLA